MPDIPSYYCLMVLDLRLAYSKSGGLEECRGTDDRLADGTCLDWQPRGVGVSVHSRRYGFLAQYV